MSLFLVAQLLVLGGIVGVLAGLLGIGGGLLVVPALVFLLPQTGVSSEVLMPMALATSLASIIITSASSAFNHIKRANVDMFAVKWLIPGVLIGGFLGATVVEWIPNDYLPQVFAVIVFMMAIQMFYSIRITQYRPLPAPWLTTLCGTVIGVLASLTGVGGGSLSVPFLNYHGVEMRKAVGSSSLCGFCIALSGMSGFVLHGYQVPNLPAYSLGYVYLPALLCVAATSVLTTQYGVRLAISFPTAKLKRVFAVFLILIAISMLVQS